MKARHHLGTAAVVACWLLLISIAVGDAVGATSVPHGVRAGAVALVVCVTLTRATARIGRMLQETKALLHEVKVEQRALIAIGEEIGAHRVHQLHQIHPIRPHKPLAVYDRNKGWVS